MDDQNQNPVPGDQVFSVDMQHNGGGSKCFDDDGRLKRTGTVWTASVRIIAAAIGTGVLSLPWATAQLGWIAGPAFLVLFSFVTFYTSTLIADCYRAGDPVTGKRNYTYMEAVQSNLSGFKVKLCGVVQYLNLFGVAIGYTIASSISMKAIAKSNCFHKKGHDNPCRSSSTPYMVAFGVIEILLSLIPDFYQMSIVTAVMSFTYPIIGLGLEIWQVAQNGKFKGSLTGIIVGASVTGTEKIWRSFQALGNIAFAYSYSIILIETQDTVRSPPSEAETMRKATGISVTVTTIFYMFYGCFGYAAFGNQSPNNLLTGFGFYNPFWLVDIANLAIIIHLFGAYQVYCRPIFAIVEKIATARFPDSDFINNDIHVSLPGGFRPYKLNLFQLIWRTIFVIATTIISMLLAFSDNIMGLLGALGFWPLTVYFPIELYIAQMKIPKWSTKWLCLQILSAACLVITIAAAAGSVAGVIQDLKNYKTFSNVD